MRLELAEIVAQRGRLVAQVARAVSVGETTDVGGSANEGIQGVALDDDAGNRRPGS